MAACKGWSCWLHVAEEVQCGGGVYCACCCRPAGLELYTIMGRTSVDIIKSVGYKISALQVSGPHPFRAEDGNLLHLLAHVAPLGCGQAQVENVLLEHPSLQEVAVLGIEDDVRPAARCGVVVALPWRAQLGSASKHAGMRLCAR